METLNIKSTHKPSQGDFVVINACDFDSAKGHVLYVEPGGAEEVQVAAEKPVAVKAHKSKGAKA